MEFGHIVVRGPGFIMDSWGAGPFIIKAEGKSWRFEDSDRFGPSLVNKDGAIRKNPYPGERSPFWKAHRLWVRQGRRLAADGITCAYDPPEPNIYRMVGRMRLIVGHGDEDGEFIEERPLDAERKAD